MSWEHRGELRADPGIAPGDRGIELRPRRSIWPSIAVAAAAAAFGGVIWFAYQNGKDANRSGPPPLVKADPNPVKVKPDSPGGQDIPFQDSTVYDRLDQKGQKPVMEKLLPPPEEPVNRPQAGTQPPPVQDATVNNQSAASALPAIDNASPTALAPLPGAAIITQLPATAPKPAQVAAVPVPPKPVSLPKSAQADPIAALENKALAQMAVKPPAATGTGYRIQLSAVRSSDAVPPEWARLKHRFPETLGGLSVISSKTNVAGKGDFYRLRAGPLDEAAAKSACGHLRTKGLDCIVVKP